MKIAFQRLKLDIYLFLPLDNYVSNHIVHFLEFLRDFLIDLEDNCIESIVIAQQEEAKLKKILTE